MDRIFEQLRICNVLLTIGSSGVVEPAASFVRMARMNNARAIYIGPEQPANSMFFDEVVLGKAGEVLPGLVKELLERLELAHEVSDNVVAPQRQPHRPPAVM